MNYTNIPEALLYKRKSVDKLVMLHPLNAIIFKRLMKMEGWHRDHSREHQILSCMNNAYYICTIMRLERDATLREDSYKRIARNGFIEDRETFVECVTLSLVALLIEHSTSEWHNKLQEIADNLHKYASSLWDEREDYILGCRDTKITNIVHMVGTFMYLSKDIDDSVVLPDELFQPRTLDEKAIFDQHRQDPTFNWDKYYYHHEEDDIREMVEMLGQTPQEKAILINSLWKDIYFSRKKLDGPIQDTWLFLKTLAQEFCPEFMKRTELHKIPETGIEFEKRISELEAEVTSLKQQVNSDVSSDQQSKDDNQTVRIIELEAQVEELQQRLTDGSGKQGWIDWLDDDVFQQNINAEEVYKTLCTFSAPNLKDRPRCYVLFRVLAEIKGLKKGEHQKDILKWWNAHFKCDWHGDNQFKFTNIPENIKTKSISDWKNCGGNNNQYYYEYAQELLKAFAWNKGRGNYEIKQTFLKKG